MKFKKPPDRADFDFRLEARPLSDARASGHSDVAGRVQKHRDALRATGLRPVQLWVTDTRRPGFAAECRRQCLAVHAPSGRKARRISLKRGDLVTWNPPRSSADCGARRTTPVALIMQRDQFDAQGLVSIVPVTDEVRSAPLLRVTVIPTTENLLAREHQVMVDHLQAVPRARIRFVFGHLDEGSMLRVSRAMAVYLGLA
jgi:mRNA interferase MazF